MSNKVPVGSTTQVGWIGAILALLPTIIRAVEEGSAVTLGGPEKYLAIGGIILAAITNIGRYAQAHKLIPQEIVHTIEHDVGTVGENFEHGVEQGTSVAPPESAVTPDGPPA